MTAGPGPNEPFKLRVGYDQDELLGARWWQEGMRLAASRPTGNVDESRRSALRTLVQVGGVVLFGGVALSYCRHRNRTSTTTYTVTRDSIELQRERGLFVDASTDRFLYPDAIATTHAGEPLDRTLLGQLASDLRPGDSSLQPAYVPTLFQAFGAQHSDAFLRDFQMVRSPAMQRSFGQGEAVRELLEHAEPAHAWALEIGRASCRERVSYSV